MPQAYIKCRRHQLRFCLRCWLPFPRSHQASPIVTAGMAAIAGGVTLLSLASFQTRELASRFEPSILTQGLVTATHTEPSIPASLVVPPKSELVTSGLCNVASVTNVSFGTTACKTVCSVQITQVSAATKQPQENTGTKAETSPEQLTSKPVTQAKSPKEPTPSSGSSTTPVAASWPERAPVVSAPIVAI